MSNSEPSEPAETTSGENKIPTAAAFVLPEELTKDSIRTSVWQQLEKANLVNFPLPCWGRIPNFKGCEQANSKLIELDVFKNAKVVKVNPDKPQEPVRVSVLENHKSLYVPIPRLREGLLSLVVLEEGCTNNDIKNAVRPKGIQACGKPIDLSAKINIDLVVLGSVAVSKEGHRIGKGEGFADLEFAMMMHMKAVNQDTIVVTTVHDNQVFDTLPHELFKAHDVPVDIIVTPTQVITIEKRLPKPTGVIWNLLSQRRLNLMPILQKLRELDQEAGKDVTLKEEDSDAETQRRYKPQYHLNRRHRYRRRSQPNRQVSESQDEGAAGEGSRPQRPKKRNLRPRRKRVTKKDGSGELAENGVDEKNEANGGTDPSNNKRATSKRRNNERRNYRKQKNTFDFSLRVGNIDRNVRVRDLKAALAERGVKPNEITWRGYKGFCVLHFAKPSSKNVTKTNALNSSAPTAGGGGDNSIGVDNIIESLQDLKLSANSEKSLVIEPAKPISRIETTDVTSV